MAYIGRDTDKLSNIEVLDAITFDGSSSYTLQKNSVNFTPSSANNVLVSIDGVVQANNFTVSGSTIDFGVAVPSTSTCDWIYHIGVGLITTPADGTVTTAKLADGSVTSAKLDSGIALGKIGQVVSATKTDNFSTTSGTPVDITGLSVNITPSSTSSKILIIASGNFSTQSRYGRAHVYLTGTTSQSVGDAGTGIESTNCVSPRAVDDGYTQDSFSINFLDSPASTSQQTYKLQLSQQAAGTAYINRPHTIDTNGGNTISTITAMEILS